MCASYMNSKFEVGCKKPLQIAKTSLKVQSYKIWCLYYKHTYMQIYVHIIYIHKYTPYIKSKHIHGKNTLN